MNNKNSRIPQHLHLIWIGENDEMPVHCIESWVKMNPGWTVHLWTNEHLETVSWHNARHIKALLDQAARLKETGNHFDTAKVYASVSDIMRYEILHAAGGFYVDASSLCVRPLEAWLFDSNFCATYENETEKPGLISNGYMASTKEHPILLELIKNIHDLGVSEIIRGPNWEKTGSGILTDTVRSIHETDNITLWPSHYFLPEYRSGRAYRGTGHVFARHYWGGLDQKDKVAHDIVASPYRAETFARFPVFNELITTPTGPRIINKNDSYIGKDLYWKGRWCGSELSLLKDFIHEGSVVIEGGANIGSHTVDLCRMAGSSGKVLAFEPQRIIFQELVCNIALNNIPNAYCYNQGLGNQKTRLPVPQVDYYKPNNFGAVSLDKSYPMAAQLASSQESREDVDIITIDSLSLLQLDVIKLNVEGMEKSVLEGGEKTIRKFAPVIYMESWRDSYGVEARSYLRSLGYSLYRHGHEDQNILALPSRSPYKTALKPETA